MRKIVMAMKSNGIEDISRYVSALTDWVFPGLNVKQFVSFFDTRNEVASGQIASSVQLYLSKKYLTGTSDLYSTRMERYKLIQVVGEGTFGCVWRAFNMETGEMVAIKKMKKSYLSWEECLNLREVKSLRKMIHPNIVKLKEVIRENDILFFVFEYMEFNLFELMEARLKPFSESEVRNCCFQVFQGLAYMHQSGYFHRDLKPENLLVTKGLIKIADFGMAREVNSLPPYTEYVSSRWYRAPEVILQSCMYSSKVDMWAMGAIMAELFTLRPLFPGANAADEIYKICNVIGSPTWDSWADGLQLASDINYQFPQLPGVKLSALVPSASDYAISLITALCSWDPSKRPTAVEALQHPFFYSCYYIPPSLHYRPALANTLLLPSARTRVVEQQGANQYSGRFPSPKSHASANAVPLANWSARPAARGGVPDVSEKLENLTIGSLKLPVVKLRPAARGGVSDVSERLENMMIGSLKLPVVKLRPAARMIHPAAELPAKVVVPGQEIRPFGVSISSETRNGPL